MIEHKINKATSLEDNTIGIALGTWLLAIIWNLLAWPIAFLVWSSKNGFGLYLLVSLFPIVGLILLWSAVAGSKKAGRVSGTELLIQPRKPGIGETFKVDITLPASRISSSQHYELNLTEGCMHASDDSLIPREVWSICQHPVLQQLPDGSGKLYAEFEIPAHCFPSDRDVDGQRTVWSLSLIDLVNSDLQNYAITVLAGNELSTAVNPALNLREPSLHANRGAGSWTPSGEFPSFVPARVMQISETNAQWVAKFSMRMSRWIGLFLLLPTVGAFLLARNYFLGNDSIDVVWWIVWMLVACIFLWLCLSQLSKTWRLVIDQHGINVRRDSWLFSKRFALARNDVTDLHKLLAYQMRSREGLHSFFQIHALTGTGIRVLIAPDIEWASVADGVSFAIKKALFNNAKYLLPVQSEADSTLPGKTSGWLLYVALAFACIGATSLNSTFLPGDPVSPERILQDWKIRFDRLTPAGRDYAEFAAAQEKEDLPAIEAFLKHGSNPNTVANNGITFLMLAARRGNLEHVNLLLRYGADVNQHDESSNDNRGDTALLVALHSGQEKVVRRLLEAGARLEVVNMWDWTPMHMAAQSNCLPCLDLLLSKGLSIHALAHASRGETPAMLAAGKGRVETLEWFVKHGADLEEKDPYGKNALDWAIFFHKENTERWIREYTHRDSIDL